MKYLFPLLGALLLAPALHAQSVADKVAARTCDCLGQLPNADSLQHRLRRCSTEGLAKVLADGTAADKQLLSTTDGMQRTYQRLFEILPDACPAVGKVLAGAPLSPPEPEGKEKRNKYYRLSESAEANKYYEEGNKLNEKKSYKAALKQYEKALALDPNFVYALDNTAVCLRQLERYDEALASYAKSLALFPEGDVALLNTAVLYTLKKDWDNSRKYYALYQQSYPNDPEGYFGLGRLALLTDDYDTAMTNLFKAHRLYAAARSAYLADSKKLIALLYGQMKKAGKTEEFQARARANGLDITEQ